MNKGHYVDNEHDAITFIIKYNPNYTSAHRLLHLADRIPHYPRRIAYCRDEKKTGRRFGNAACRRDLNPVKIGGGGRNKTDRVSYQLWVWDVE